MNKANMVAYGFQTKECFQKYSPETIMLENYLECLFKTQISGPYSRPIESDYLKTGFGNLYL